MKPRVPTERSFGLTIGSLCLAAAAVSWWRGHLPTAQVLAATGAALVTGGMIAPAALRVPNRIWWRFAQALGWINSRILLTAFFFLVITPVAVVLRAIGRNPLRTPDVDSGWSPYSARARDHRHYERLF